MAPTLRILAILAVIASPTAAFAEAFNPITLTRYAIETGTTPQEFMIYGDVFGPNNIVSVGPYGKTWQQNFTFDGKQQPYWSVYASIFPPDSIMLGTGTASIKISTTGGFEYHSYISGTNTTPDEFWSHEVTMTGPEDAPLVTLIGVRGAFDYVETVLQASQYSTDGSTVPLWTTFDARGTTTLTEMKSIYPEAFQVPEPASLALVGIAGFALSSRRVFRKTVKDPDSTTPA